ncbi:MAG TPA: bifunctional helix-turn-helix transcriptional regulator/GNAT family N-acetyltransferase [Gemmatimonadaceae bacterium]|nr:bifunctional helix-turn-helix transcriptional regulator/GNAT family N-acetyltransferase [Gemmatimonadaceae bacterium]
MPEDLHPQVPKLRQASRSAVRELGMLRPTFLPGGCSQSQVHAMVEIERHGQLTVAELAETLRLDKSSASRSLAQLVERGWLRAVTDAGDARRKPLALTAKGRDQLSRINDAANRQVHGALDLLDEEERDVVLRGMELYAKALERWRKRAELEIRPIRRADDPAMARVIRLVMTEFGAVGPGYSINDPEVTAMSDAYQARDRSAYFVIDRAGEVVGGGGVAPLTGADPSVCELRKMYFLPELRGLGMGKAMLATCLDAARALGFTRCYLETLRSMARAQLLYRDSGFTPLAGPMGNTGHSRCDVWMVKEL